MGFMVVRTEEEKRVNLNEISTLIIENTDVSITVYLMAELIAHKIKVIFCDGKRNPVSELLPYYGSHDTSSKIRQQVKWTKNQKAIVWKEIVRQKLYQQATLLRECGKDEENKMLMTYVDQVEIGDTTNREGHGAKVYFNAMFGNSFVRHTDGVINAALDFGYTVLLSAFNREIVANGYLTQMGIFHDNTFNQFNLGSDFMEAFRPLVDRAVINSHFDVFERDEKNVIINILNDKIIIDGKMQFVNNAIGIYVRGAIDALENGNTNLIYMYEI
jgi:CRISPR-associated endonuclease Cas1 subtype II